MAQTYTLDEAAEKLNLSVEELKRRLRSEWTQVRSFRDGSTLRFRANEIDELARSIGLGSSEELPLAEGSDLDIPVEIGLADDKAKPATPKTPTPSKKASSSDSDAPLKLDDSDEMFLITPEPPVKSPSSKRLKSKSDSDVRLEKGGKKVAASDDEESILTEDMELPSQGGSGKLSGKSGRLSSAKLKSESGKLKTGDSGKPKSGDSGKQKAAPKADDSSSEFELSLEADSDEFELSLAPDSSEEVSLGDVPPEPGNKAGQSGINLNRPADSGVSLEKRKPAANDDDEIDFELSLETPGSGSSRKKLGSGKKLDADSDSEFELTLEEPSDLTAEASADKKGDIFEATDFEIPALEDDSASEAVSLDEADTDLESSDFDLALDEDDAVADDESASEVVELDEEEVSSAKSKMKGKKKKKPVDDEDEGEIDLGDVELEEGASASAALRGVRDDEDEEGYTAAGEVDVDEKGRPMVAAKWGPFPAILMFPTVIVMFLGGLMAYETLHSMWGYQQANKPTTPLVSWFAEKFDMKPAQ